MSDGDLLRDLVDEGGALTSVRLVRFENDAVELEDTSNHDAPERFLTSVTLSFERRQLVLSVDANTDEIVLHARTAILPDDVAAIDVSDRPPWSRLIGRRILWAWMLTNQQGYTDGARFELVSSAIEDHASTQHTVIELIAVASGLHVFISTRIP